MEKSDLLIIIDMQEGFRYKESMSIIPKLKETADKFRGKVVFSYFENKNGSKFEKDLKWKKFQNKDEQQILREFTYLKAKKFKHNDYTILNKSLLDFISKKHFKTVYLSGIYTDVCIIKTAMDAFDNNISVKVIGNCCTSLHGLNNHKYAIDSLRHIIGKNNVVNF